jgi:hypothetical protein
MRNSSRSHGPSCELRVRYTRTECEDEFDDCRGGDVVKSDGDGGNPVAHSPLWVRRENVIF